MLNKINFLQVCCCPRGTSQETWRGDDGGQLAEESDWEGVEERVEGPGVQGILRILIMIQTNEDLKL